MRLAADGHPAGAVEDVHDLIGIVVTVLPDQRPHALREEPGLEPRPVVGCVDCVLHRCVTYVYDQR